MTRSMLAAAIAFLLSVAAPVAADPVESVNARIDEVLGDHRPYEAAVLALKKAVARHDRTAIAALVNYPMRFSASVGRAEIIRNPAQFRARYDQIIDPTVARLIVSQAYGTLFVRDQGLMFGNGEVWISGACLDRTCRRQKVGIVTIQHLPSPKNRSS